MKNSKILLLIITFLVLVSFSSSCSLIPKLEHKQTIGVFMPCDSNERWKRDADEINQILLDHGYNVVIYYANRSSELQKTQIEDAMASDVVAIIISVVNTKILATTLDVAYEKGIKIIAYDKLPLDTTSIAYFASFDSYLIGVQQATSLVNGLKSQGNGPYNIELFSGYTLDKNAINVYKGAMSVLRPMIDNDNLNVLSGEISMSATENKRGTADGAIERFNSLLLEYYSDGTPLHGILSPRDSISIEFIKILSDNSIYTSSVYPIITGQNSEIENIRAIIDSKQYSTVFKDHLQLAQIACSMVTAALNDEIPEINDTTSFYNGKIIVPAFLCEPILITKANYKEVLIDSGYIEYEDIFP